MDDHEITVKTRTDAKKETIAADEALVLAKSSQRILAAKGKKIVEFSLKNGQLEGDATEETLRKAIIGPSGNLRAPSIWQGKTLYVGFHPEMYEGLL